jgi:hypothetical protein
MRISRTIGLAMASAAVLVPAAVAGTATSAAAAPASPAASCHIRALSDGVRIRQAPDPNSIVDGLLYREQTLPSDCGGFSGAGHPGCVGGWSTDWIGVTFNGRRDYVSFTGDCIALHFS